jgi:hypothetical protein
MYYFKSFKSSDDGIHKYEITFENDENKRTKTIKFGAKDYNDYTIYYKEDGKKKADEMKDAYIARHKVNEKFDNPYTAGALSRWILWNKPTVKESLVDYIKRFRLNKSS